MVGEFISPAVDFMVAELNSPAVDFMEEEEECISAEADSMVAVVFTAKRSPLQALEIAL